MILEIKPLKTQLLAVVDVPYVSGIQKWNGNKPDLIAKPIITSIIPSIVGISRLLIPLIAVAIFSIDKYPVKSYKITIPIKNNPEPTKLKII